jgi:hypothetical protein
MDIRITAADLDLIRRNILDVLDPDLSEVVEKVEARGNDYVLRFLNEAQAESFVDIAAEEGNLAIGALPGQFDDLMDRMEDQIDQGGAPQ